MAVFAMVMDAPGPANRCVAHALRAMLKEPPLAVASQSGLVGKQVHERALSPLIFEVFLCKCLVLLVTLSHRLQQNRNKDCLYIDNGWPVAEVWQSTARQS